MKNLNSQLVLTADHDQVFHLRQMIGNYWVSQKILQIEFIFYIVFGVWLGLFENKIWWVCRLTFPASIDWFDSIDKEFGYIWFDPRLCLSSYFFSVLRPVRLLLIFLLVVEINPFLKTEKSIIKRSVILNFHQKQWLESLVFQWLENLIIIWFGT